MVPVAPTTRTAKETGEVGSAAEHGEPLALGLRREHEVPLAGVAHASPTARPSTGGPGTARRRRAPWPASASGSRRAAPGRRPAGRCARSPRGTGCRPTPGTSRRRRSTGCPACAPACGSARSRTSPTCTTSPLSCCTRSVSPAPVTRCTHGASSRWTWIGTGLQRQQLAHPADLVAHHVAAHVVRVVVGGERAGDAHAVGGGDVEDAPHVVGGVDDDGLAGRPVADQVDEVDHLPGERVGRAMSRPASSWRK